MFKVNPRYILYVHLVSNDILLLGQLIILYILSYTVFTLNVSLCMVLIMLAVFTNINTPMILAIMAIECYVAVCHPLHHSHICTIRKTYIVNGFIWAVSVMTILPDLFVSLATEPIAFFRQRVFCLRNVVFRHPVLVQKREILYILLFVLVWLTLLYTYSKIIFAAQSASTDAKKARNTILLHSFQLMLSMLTYFHSNIITSFTNWFPHNVLVIRFWVTILVNIMPRLVSPLVYGLRDKAFRKYLKYYFLCLKK